LYFAALNDFVMNTEEIIKEIQRLPISKRIYIIEKTIKSLRKKEEKKQMKDAADVLYDDYKNDEELTAFTKYFQDEVYN
jgi:hypothetical protein